MVRADEGGATRRPLTIPEFDDARLAAIYDTVNTHDPNEQPRFVRRLVDRLQPGSVIIDLGCGTGLITRGLAALGHRVIGVDRSAEMIAVGRGRPFGDRVEWTVGDAAAIGTPDADLAIMTSHVAQFFVDDQAWDATLGSLHRALRAGGRLGFESRNPSAREWERWTSAHVTSVVDPEAGAIDTWTEVHEVRDGVVGFTNRYRFVERGEVLASSARLRFRTRDELVDSVVAAGFTVERIDGYWDGRPADAASPEHIVVARR